MDHVRNYVREAPACAVVTFVCLIVYCAEVLQAGSLSTPVDRYDDGHLAWRLMMVAPEVTGNNEWWRLVTSAFVHLNIAHLVMNLLLLVLMGRELERAYGTIAMAASMLLCAIGGSLAVLWFTPGVAVGGASTIAYGMFAMLVGLSVARKTDVRGPLVLIAVNLVFTVTAGGVSLAGHLGGLAAGAVVALVLSRYVRRNTISTPWSSAVRR